MPETIVVGAGLSGLTAALTLASHGRSVHVIDKGRGVGGRLATRRIGSATLDHGAQFFTVRGDDFRETVDAAIADGIVDVWCHGFDKDDGYPRYYCPAGMTSLAKWLRGRLTAAGGVVHAGERVASISAKAQTFELSTDSGTGHSGDDLIMTPPVPQVLEVLAAGGITLDEPTDSALRAITYKPTLALLVTLEGASAVPSPGGIQRSEDELFTFIGDNLQKGVSEASAVTFHVNGATSEARWDDNEAVVIAELLREAAPWLGTAPVVDVELKKWRYAGPYVPHADRCFMATTTPGRLIVAGDAFGGPKIEGAFNSGRAAAEVLLATN